MPLTLDQLEQLECAVERLRSHHHGPEAFAVEARLQDVREGGESSPSAQVWDALWRADERLRHLGYGAEGDAILRCLIPNPVLAAFEGYCFDGIHDQETRQSIAGDYAEAARMHLEHERPLERPAHGWPGQDPFDLVERWPARVTLEQLRTARDELVAIEKG